MSIPSIPEFYARKDVFITGATGFLGKALIEKLLRSCPDIGKIYILVRPKRGKQLQERLNILISDVLYERLKREQPGVMEKKIIPLAGDVTLLNLGLSKEDRKIVTDNVNIVFHVAASVRFDDLLRDSIMMNVRGTREVCQISLDAKNLVAHVHVSTAFANCDRPEAKEVLYDQKLDWRHMIEIAEKFDSYTLDVLATKFMDKMPNTYCFTKHIAEHVANDMLKGKMPLKIFRPSIVVSTMREEPVTGWIDNFNGPLGILVAYGKGVMRTLYTHHKYKPDYIPVDVVTKALIVSTWDIVMRNNRTTPEVIQCTSHNTADWLRPTAETLAFHAYHVHQELPLNDVMWTTSKHTTANFYVWYIRTVFLMLIPAMLIDGMLKLAGKKPMLTKIQRKIFIAQLALRHFMNNEWIYHNDGLLALQKRIKASDFADWDYKFSDFDFNAYMRICMIGCRRYLLKESDDTIPKARRHYQRMLIIDRAVRFILFGLIIWFVWNLGFVKAGFQRMQVTI